MSNLSPLPAYIIIGNWKKLRTLQIQHAMKACTLCFVKRLLAELYWKLNQILTQIKEDMQVVARSLSPCPSLFLGFALGEIQVGAHAQTFAFPEFRPNVNLLI